MVFLGYFDCCIILHFWQRKIPYINCIFDWRNIAYFHRQRKSHWTISYGEESRDFVDSDYELIDIYRIEYAPEVYAYLKEIDVRVLTEDDLVMIDDKIKDIANTIMIDLNKGESGDSDGSEGDSDVEVESVPLQEVIVNMNNSITKLEQTKVEPETIEHSEIDQLFS